MNKFKITVEEQVTYTHEIEVETEYNTSAVDNILCEIDDDLMVNDTFKGVLEEFRTRGMKFLTETKNTKREIVRITDMEELK